MDRQAMSFEMGARLKSLREEKGLSYKELAEALFNEYEIKISKDSLRDYEISSDYRSKSKSLPNLGMRTEYLIALSDFYEVSTDYLLCKTDVRTINCDIQCACMTTGLSDKAINNLVWLKNGDPLYDNGVPRFHKNILQMIDFFLRLRSAYSLMDDLCRYQDCKTVIETSRTRTREDNRSEWEFVNSYNDEIGYHTNGRWRIVNIDDYSSLLCKSAEANLHRTIRSIGDRVRKEIRHSEP